MTRRRLLLLALLVALVLVGGAAWGLWSRPSSITLENAAKLHNGMTLMEVETILGGPSRDESTGPLNLDFTGSMPNEKFHCRWISNEVLILVCFDTEDRVIYAEFEPVHLLPVESLFERFRRWLGV
jgi:hypothetical protein